MKKVYKDQWATVHWSAASNEKRLAPRRCTARQPLVVFPNRFHVIFVCPSFRGDVQESLSTVLGGGRVGHL